MAKLKVDTKVFRELVRVPKFNATDKDWTDQWRAVLGEDGFKKAMDLKDIEIVLDNRVDGFEWEE